MMYINEAIRQADALSPNEYTLQEKYAWCDELNAMLMQEHLNKYASVDLEPDEDGAYLLPEGITFEMVEKIIAQGRSIEKYDFRSFGIEPRYTPRERFYAPAHCQARGTITVIYLAQAQPIRAATASGTIGEPKSGQIYDFGEYDVSTGQSENYIGVGNIGFEIPNVGDTVKFSVSEDCSEVMLPMEAFFYNVGGMHIKINHDFRQGVTYYGKITKQFTYTTTPGPHTVYTETKPAEARVVTDADKWAVITASGQFQAGDTVKITYGETEKNVNVSYVEIDDGNYRVCLYETLNAENNTECTVERIVTDQTLVPAPYDQMYIDWIMAKIAFYQKNYTVYNQIMNKFYDVLGRFDNWRIQRDPADKDNKIRNWLRM